MNGSSFKNKIDFLVCSCRSCLQDSFAPDWGAPDAHWVMWLSQEDCSSFAFNVSPVPGTTSLMWAATYWWNWMLWNGREHQKAHLLVKAFGQPKKKTPTKPDWGSLDLDFWCRCFIGPLVSVRPTEGGIDLWGTNYSCSVFCSSGRDLLTYCIPMDFIKKTHGHKYLH